MKNYKNQNMQFVSIENRLFENDTFENMVIRHSTFKNCKFKKVKFKNNNFQHTKFINCKFIDSDTAGMVLQKDNIKNTSFKNDNLEQTENKKFITWNRKQKIDVVTNIDIF